MWALLRWLTYILVAMATVWRRGRDVEEAPSRRSGGQVGSGRVKPGVEFSHVPSKYRVGVVQSGPVRSGPTSPQRVEVRSCRPITTNEKSHQSHQHHIEKGYDAPLDASEREEGGKRGATAGR